MDSTTGEVAGPIAQEGIGVVCPFDMALDRELWRWMPQDVSLFFTRTPFVDEPVSVEMAEDVSDDNDVHLAAKSLSAVNPRVVAYACTSGSFVNGVAGARHISKVMEAASGAPGISTSEALLEALDHLGASRVVAVTPYVEELTLRLGDFLEEAGHSVVSQAGLGLEGGIWEVPYRTTCELIRAADVPDADVIFISCTNLPTYDIIAPLERELGKPVLSANQVTAWASLRRLGKSAVGPGQRLLS
ncbi:Asp/Glu/hydantoin racemase [Arthrobacter sp. FW306-04-A]|uniref:maleate cis-trans isomerase family protein n=1 Tax=Arthrobacter sp. FW306-04-A TaxID=2879619 RepID=UPI0037C18EF1|nr:Asp/Glu/hydantoin racemase [Arthrobacter sp. FW306-04-A]